jgi:methionine--tRNA ligase beta chain
MKEGAIVTVSGREGTLVFVDRPWILPSGEPADLLCKVRFENGELNFFRLSEIMISDKVNKSQEKMKPKIEFEEFLEIEKRLEIKIGAILSAERMPKSEKMLKLSVFFGGEECTVMTNIGNKIDPDTLKGRKFPFITNLKPIKIMGVESVAMIMIPTINGSPVQFLSDFSEQPLAGSILL